MKRPITCAVLLLAAVVIHGQEPIPKFAISLNPLGFLQFGPILSAEIGVKEDVAVNLHVRPSTLGLLTWIIRDHSDGLDEMSGIGFGGGVLKFFGENRHKPYMGVFLEYDQWTALYGSGDQWEWNKEEKSGVFVFNGGYRFRFGEGFFINTGAFLGAAVGRYNWDYTDTSYGSSDNDPREGTSVTPFGMLELAVGLAF